MSTTALASWPLQVAIVSLLGTHGSTSGYTLVDSDQNAAYPFISLGPETGVDDSDKSIRGSEVVIQLDFWGYTSKDVKQMMAAVADALSSERLDLSESSFNVLRTPVLALSGVFIDQDPQTDTPIRHGLQQWRFRLHAA